MTLIEFLAADKFAIYGPPVIAILLTALVSALASVSRHEAVLQRKLFYFGPMLAWMSLGLGLSSIVKLAGSFVNSGGFVPIKEAAYALEAGGFLFVWFILYLIIFVLHTRYELTDDELKALPDLGSAGEALRSGKRDCVIYLIFISNILGLVSVGIYHFMLVGAK